MAKTLQLRRYPFTTVANTIGANGEIIVDTTYNIVTVHDGITPGGFRVATQNAQIQAVSDAANSANSAANSAVQAANSANAANTILANTNFNTVASNTNSINAVNNNSANINIVAASAGNINIVAANTANINSLNSNTANIAIVSGNTANINSVAANIANVNIVASGVITPRVVIIPDGTSITMNSANTDVALQTNSQVAGILTINAPLGSPYNLQKLVLRISSANVQTLSFNSVFAGSVDLPLPTSTSGGGLYDYYGFLYNSTTTKWQLLSKIGGF